MPLIGGPFGAAAKTPGVTRRACAECNLGFPARPGRAWVTVDGEDGLVTVQLLCAPRQDQEPRQRCSVCADAIRTAAAATPTMRSPGITPAGDALTAVREGSPTSPQQAIS